MPCARIHPQNHRHAIGRRATLTLPGERQQPPRLGIQRATAEKSRQRRRGDGHDDDQQRHHHDQLDEREGAWPPWSSEAASAPVLSGRRRMRNRCRASLAAVVRNPCRVRSWYCPPASHRLFCQLVMSSSLPVLPSGPPELRSYEVGVTPAGTLVEVFVVPRVFRHFLRGTARASSGRRAAVCTRSMQAVLAFRDNSRCPPRTHRARCRTRRSASAPP